MCCAAVTCLSAIGATINAMAEWFQCVSLHTCCELPFGSAGCWPVTRTVLLLLPTLHACKQHSKIQGPAIVHSGTQQYGSINSAPVRFN